MPPQYQAPKGTLDILPPDSARIAALVALFARAVEAQGFGLIVGPMFEDVAVYERVGATTDIVRKEMYDFRDKAERHLALRPDSTPSVVRAFIEHRPVTPWKVWYLAPHFRYDQPQYGRYRQHHSLGVEVLGSADPGLDAEVVELGWRAMTSTGVQGVDVLLNSLGDDVCRPAYRAALLMYLDRHAADLCPDHRDHYRDNPMRVLDCKKDACRVATEAAPRFVDHLCDPCQEHFAGVQAALDALAVPYRIDTRLVRGQDYYTRTTFEYVATSVEVPQFALGGGGRYDGFVEALGGPATSGIGFGLGVERILLAADAEGVFPAPDSALDVFVVDTTGGDAGLVVAAELRAAGLRVDRAYDGRSFNAQLKSALRSGARLALVIEAQGLQLRTLQDKGTPEAIERSGMVEQVRKRLA